MNCVEDAKKGKQEIMKTEKSKVHVNIRLGGDCMRKFGELVEMKHKRSEFHCIVEQDALNYHFQPIYNAANGEVFAYEALMRVNLPTFKSPETVVTFAKEENRLADVERITMFKSAECYHRLLEQHRASDNAYLFVNSIANVCMTEDDGRQFYRKYGDLRDRMVIEITETEDIKAEYMDIKRKSKIFSGLFALDDYGSGYNSAKTLIMLKPRFVKVDMCIIRDIDKNRDKQQIVKNIVDYAHRRNMLVIAEGIETANELITSMKLRADLLQGFYLAKPSAEPCDINPAAQDIIDRFNCTQISS
jgi:EAL domain-containing protein (putative c-di-GMP-specific phosphodiesterase class I)